MKVEKIEDKLFDLYGLTQSEATYLWHDKLYSEVLRDKIDRAKKIQKGLMDAPMLKRDAPRIKRVGEAISHCIMLLKEVEK